MIFSPGVGFQEMLLIFSAAYCRGKLTKENSESFMPDDLLYIFRDDRLQKMLKEVINMAKDNEKSVVKRKRTAKQVEDALISLTIDLVERQLREGTATSQVITHFLKLATTREKLENERLKGELELSKAKIRQIDRQESLEQTYKEAIEAMGRYRGAGMVEEEEIYD